MFSTSGGLGSAAKTLNKRFVSLIAEKHDQPYSLTLVATFCNHVSSWLKTVIPSSACHLTLPLIQPAQQAGMLNFVCFICMP